MHEHPRSNHHAYTNSSKTSPTFKPPQTHSNLQTQISAKPIYEPLSTKEQKKETRIYSSETSLKDDIPLEKHAKVKLQVRLEQSRHSTIIILRSLF